MNLKTKIYLGLSVIAIFVAGILGSAAWSTQRIAKLERTVEETKRIADQKQALAAAKEVESAEYRQKIEYLERQLSDIQTKARKQDEKLEKLSVNSGRARVDVERAKRTRAIDTDATELCRKLAELGHPCE